MPDKGPTPPKRSLEETLQPNPEAAYVELGLSTCFSFLRGASDAVDFTRIAHELGYHALGVTDWNTFAGVVRIHAEAKKAGIRPVIGCRLILIDGTTFLAYPKTRSAYGRLSTLLSRGKTQTVSGDWQIKGVCDITLDDLIEHAEGTILVLLPGYELDGLAYEIDELKKNLPEFGYVAASYLYRGNDRARIRRLDRIARQHGLKLLATNDVLYHTAKRRPLQDVMTCIREKTTLGQAGFHLQANAERYLKSPEEMCELFAEWPHAIQATCEIAEQCQFSLDELRYEYPKEHIPEGHTPQSWLTELTWLGADERYPSGLPKSVRARLEHELILIGKMGIARYFLTVRDVVNFARTVDPPILCQGRGSAANSAVCYVLGITAVDPSKHDLLFERFISEQRNEPPDIDVDFEHERREEVIQHIYATYGRQRAGLCATVIHYRPRSAIREVGKVLGLSEDITSALAKTIWGSWGREIGEAHAREAGVDINDPLLKRAISLADELIGMPRHLSQHVGGFILTENPLVETVPIGTSAMADRTFIEWDKDDIDELGILKIDVLALGMLTCIRKCFDLLTAHYGTRYDLATLPPEDSQVYDMLCQGDSVGVFQVESRAQMNMLPRLRPRSFYDLVIEVAIVRPGPIQGDMVHPYLKRRDALREGVLTEIDYPKPGPEHDPDELKKILGRTLGVPIFQEQAMKIAIDAAKFSPDEANELRKAMATFRSRGTIGKLQDKMVGRMIERGYDAGFAQRCFDQIKGFGEYGFPESHAASFALLVYVSSWLKCHYPAVFACGLLNSQPMGFYAPAQIVRDAVEHGVEVRQPDVNYSYWDNSLEPVRPGLYALRLGFRQIDSMSKKDAEQIVEARHSPFVKLAEIQARANVKPSSLRVLAAADAFRSLGLDRRQALWETRALKQTPNLPLFNVQHVQDEGWETPVKLPEMPMTEHVVADYQTTRLSLKSHPLRFMRKSMTRQNYISACDLKETRHGMRVSLAGIVLVRQRPGSAKGVCFITIEDETGVANLVVWPNKMIAFRKVIMTARLIAVHGIVQRDPKSDVIHVVADRLEDRTAALARLSDDLIKPEISNADEVKNPLPAPNSRHPRNVNVIPKSRDFH